MGTFKHLQRKSGIGSTPGTSTSHWLRSSRPFAPARVPTPEQVSPPQQAQPSHSTPLNYSLADIPLFPPERKNRADLPNNLQAGIEKLSGMSMDDVHVHYNSSKPAEMQALAYTQGTEIHVGPGQEKHLPHEAWHVVQQKQGRVKPTLQQKGVAINVDERLEKEANEMGERANHVSGGSLQRKDASGFDSLVKNQIMNPFAKSILSKRDTISKPLTIIQRMEGPAPLLVLTYAQGYGHTTAEAQLAWAYSPNDILLLLVKSIIYTQRSGEFGTAELYFGYKRDLDAVWDNLSQLRNETHPQLEGAKKFVAHLRFLMRLHSQNKRLNRILPQPRA